MKKQFLLLMMTLLPLVASADVNGTCGKNLTWYYVEATQTLTISGTGEMYNSWLGGSAPWSTYPIKEVIVEDGVTSIGQTAFSGCSSLASINIPNSVTTIYEYAFSGCNSLTSINIPNSVTAISSSAFSGCNSLTSINVETDNPKYDSRDNCNGIIETETNKLIIGCKNTNIPNSVTSIGGSAFERCSSLTSINIPNSVTSIGRSAFENCSSLTSINIPNSVTSIGRSAFENCSSLTSINIPNSVTSIGLSAFENCSSLTSINIPNSVTSIRTNTFLGCSSLTSINIPNSVTSIGGSAFENCSSLTSINIPNSVTSIDIYAFHGCSSLTSINIPNSVTSIDIYAFHGCSSLTSINVETGNPKYDSRDNCNGIIETETNKLIIGCKNTSIPNSVTSIDIYVFDGCSSLTSINIPNSVTSIGRGAFQGCKLETIICRCPLVNASQSFSSATFNHAVLYVPEGKRWEAIYDGGWYPFINIRETVMNVDELSTQKAYMVMNAHTFDYMVYDAINNGTKFISDFHNVDESVANNSWQIVENNGQKYLYNIGTRRYAVIKSSGEWELTDTPIALSMESDTDGKFTINGNNTQWYFVPNEQATVDHSVMAVETIAGDAKAACYYTLNGQRTEKQTRGVKIVVLADGTKRKVVTK